MTVTDAKYVRLTTFTRAGGAKATPVWIAALPDGDAGFTTGSASWKVTRIRHSPDVLLQPSDVRGNPIEGSTEVAATARLATAEEDAQIRQAIRAKYGWQVPVMQAVGRIAQLVGRPAPGDTTIILTVVRP